MTTTRSLLTVFVFIVLSIGVSLATDACSCSMWPAPAKVIDCGSNHVDVDVKGLKIDVVGATSAILTQAIDRYLGYIHDISGDSSQVNTGSTPTLSKVTIDVLSASEILDINTNETYALDIGGDGTCEIAADNVFGAMHALESFTQLISNGAMISCAPFRIVDYPAYPHRGLMINTSRHFFPVSYIMKMIDAVSFSKLNVFHWHIEDAQTFPIEIPQWPLLSSTAYCPECVFSLSDVAQVVDYAKARGVRVVMEIDTPGHSYSWGVSYPELVVKCPDYEHNINNIPLNPIKQHSYDAVSDVIMGLLTSQSQITQSPYFHLGGDEVVYGCWNESEEIVAFMKSKQMESFDELLKYYVDTLHGNLSKMNVTMTSVFWQEIFLAGAHASLPKESTVIHIWSDPDLSIAKKVIESGTRALWSSGWYLNQYQLDWKALYTNAMPESPLVLGGEACTWSDHVDLYNHEAVTWPRAAVVGERLWSPGPFSLDGDGESEGEVMGRLIDFRCSVLVKRGIHGAPIAPGYCVV